MQYAYFFIAYCMLNAVFYTANGVAYNSLSATLTKNQVERIKMGVVLTFSVLIGSILISSATIGMVSSFGGGVKGWRVVALAYTIGVIVCEIICALSIKEVGYNDDDTTPEPFHNLTFVQSVKYLLGSKYYLLILAYYILYYFSNGVFGAVGIYYCIHALHNESLYGLLSAATMVPMILGVVFTPALVKKYGMYKTNTVSLLLSAASCIFLVLGGYAKIFPILIAGLILKSLFFGPMSGSVNAIIAEISNYETLRSGVHLEGIMYSCVSLGQKLGGGLASAITGWMLSLAHYNGTLTTQPASANQMIQFLYLILPSVCAIFLYMLIKKIDVWSAIDKLMEKA